MPIATSRLSREMPSGVFSWGHRLKMIGPNARRVLAKVIYIHPLGNGPDEVLIAQAMHPLRATIRQRTSSSTVQLELSVPRGMPRCSPLPTTISRSLADLGHESSELLFVHSEQRIIYIQPGSPTHLDRERNLLLGQRATKVTACLDTLDPLLRGGVVVDSVVAGSAERDDVRVSVADHPQSDRLLAKPGFRDQVMASERAHVTGPQAHAANSLAPHLRRRLLWRRQLSGGQRERTVLDLKRPTWFSSRLSLDDSLHRPLKLRLVFGVAGDDHRITFWTASIVTQ